MAARKKTDDEPDPFDPRLNPDLEGHDEAEAALAANLRSARPAHAWLITGPRGVGKATFAFRAARFVLAGAGAGAAPSASGLFGDEVPASDGARPLARPMAMAPGGARAMAMAPDHPVFRQIAAGSHGGLKVLKRERSEKPPKEIRTKIVVEQVRRLNPFFGTTAAADSWRVAIVDSADELNRSSANALLKLLEEPPPKSLFLLASNAPGRLLPTVRSRCRILKLRPLADATVARVLAARMPDLDAADRTALAALAEGSPGRALHLAGEGGLDLYREMIGLIDTDRLDIAAVYALGDRLNRKNAEGAYRALTGLVLQWLERLVRGAAVAGEAVPELTANEGTLRQRLLAVRGLEDWLEVWEKAALRVAEADAANLERKQTVISLFAAIHRAAHV